MGGTRQTTVIPETPAVNTLTDIANHNGEYYLIVHAWQEDDSWGRGFSLSKNVGHASISISVPNGSIPEGVVPNGIQLAHLGLAEESNFYISLWPEYGASLTEKKGKIIPNAAIMSTYALDCITMSSTGGIRYPESSQKIFLSQENHAGLLTQAIQMKLRANKIYRDTPSGNINYAIIPGQDTLQYCFVNTNLSLSSRFRGVVAYNCTGAVQILLQTAGIPINSALIQFPTSLARKVTPYINVTPHNEAEDFLAQPASHANPAGLTEDFHATPTNLSVIQEDAENSESSDSRSNFSI